MRPRETIFDSASEKELFHALNGAWEPHYVLYPQTPFPNVITDLDPQLLDAAQLAFLHHTSIDYVLTTPEGRPLFALEFDGMGHGYSKDGRYVQKVPTPKAPTRQWRLDLKARVADVAGFPFAIVSYDEKAVVDEEANLTVVHGMIGGFLAHHHAQARMTELLELESDRIANLSPEEQFEYIQDYVVIAAEVEADATWNPIVKQTMAIRQEYGTIWPMMGSGMSWPDEGPLPPAVDPASPEFDHFARKRWLDAEPRKGWIASVQTPLGWIERTAWVRNIQMPGTTALSLAGEVAELLVWQEALRQARKWKADHPNGGDLPPIPPFEVRTRPRDEPKAD